MKMRSVCGGSRWVLGLAVCAMAACSSSSGGSGGGGGGDGTDGSTSDDSVPIVDTDKQQVAGRVTDVAGDGLGGVTIAAAGASTTSNAKGYFNLALPGGEHTVQLSAAGFVPVQKRITVLEGTTRLETRMMARAPAVALDAGAGGAVDGMRGAQMIAPAGAFVDGEGNAVEGEVSVHLTAFDPSVSGELAAYPGDLTAETESGETTALESFGVLDVTVMQGDETLQVKEGTMLEIAVPAPATATDPPEMVALWSFDEERALWIEEGMATYDAESHTYKAQIPHMSPWNADQPLTATCVQGTVVEDETNEPVSGGQVSSHGTDYLGYSEAFTDASGVFCLPVKAGGKAVITAIHPAGGGTQKEIEAPSDVVPVDQCQMGNCNPALVLEEPCRVVPQQVIDPDGQAVDCGAIGNPLDGTCAAGLGTLFSCWRPSGDCTISADGIRYENGSRFRFTGGGGIGSGSTQGTYVGPNGETCGTFDVDTSDLDNVVTTVTVNGQAYSMSADDTDGSTTIQCPNGQTVSLSATEQAAIDACGSAETSECTTEGPAGGTCSSDADCSGAAPTCCLIEGIGFCATQMICDAAQQ